MSKRKNESVERRVCETVGLVMSVFVCLSLGGAAVDGHTGRVQLQLHVTGLHHIVRAECFA